MSDPDQSRDSDMAAQKVFRVLSSAAGDGCSARLGKLSLPGRNTIDTPTLTAVTSRGVVPHLTPEVVSKYTSISTAYMALEDFIEKKDPPILKTPARGDDTRRLHDFTAFPRGIATIMAARRCPSVVPPAGNTAKALSIFTSTGFGSITVPQYVSAVETLRPDIVVPLADLLYAGSIPVAKKQLRMAERTEDWVDNFMDLLDAETRTQGPHMAVFAPVLAVDHPVQWNYLSHLSEDLADQMEGLAIYDINILPELTSYKPLGPLAKLSLDLPSTPHDILRQVSLGVDMILGTFVNSISDAGVALTFTLPPPEAAATLGALQPLGVDLWSAEHRMSATPLQDGCPCYACQKHHRAFVNHLLHAKEMLGWNLLQIHNHHVVDQFFAAIRAALARGGQEELDRVARLFTTAYEPELPPGTGERPRARGYHFKSEVAQDKYNKPGWQDLNGGQQSETPVAPEEDSKALEAKGFAEKESK